MYALLICRIISVHIGKGNLMKQFCSHAKTFTASVLFEERVYLKIRLFVLPIHAHSFQNFKQISLN